MLTRTISDLGITEEFIAPGQINRPGTKMTPTTITIHNTDNTSLGAGAKAHSRFVRNTGYYWLNGKKHPVSWHFTVDDTDIIQHLPIDEMAYHAGARANASSVAIEICMNPDSDESQANAKATALVAALIVRLGLGIGALRRHRDWTGKDCPRRLLAPSDWDAFVASVRANLRSGAAVAALDADGNLAAAQVEPVQSVADWEIDHEALEAVLEKSGPVSSSAGNPGQDPVGVLQRVVDELVSAPSASLLLFPHGVTEIALTLPAGGSLTIRGPAGGAPAGDGPDPDHGDETSCEAPDFGVDGAMAAAEGVDTQLPASTRTFYAYGGADKRFGTAATIRAVETIAAAYFAQTGIRLGIGNISLRGGGPIPPHDSHRRGVDVDMRVPRDDGREAPATWRDPAYSRVRAQQLVDLVRANSVRPVRTILFNDSRVSGVRPWPGHDNHLHVSFAALPTGAALPDLDSAGATRAFAAPRSGSDLDQALAENGFAKVLVALAPDDGGLAAAAAVPALAAAADDAFAACFSPPDTDQAASLVAAAVAESPADHALPPPPVTVFPRLGVALGTVSQAKIEDLRRHRRTREVFQAPEFSLIRPPLLTAVPSPRAVEWGIDRLSVPQAWAAGLDGRGIVVGHLDTGIDASHPALAGALHSFAEFDLTGQQIVGAQPRDGDRHGTHTAGTIAGRRFGNRGRIGVAPGCQLASALVIEGGNVVARILAGLEWIVEENARVLSMSLGLRSYTTAFQVVIDALWSYDVLPVIAVGNEYANSSRSPGNYSNVLSIGAMGSDDTVATFSSSQRFARAIEPLVPSLVAPGVDVVSCVPGGGYEKMSGSSMATPHVAGLAAILRQAVPTASAREVEAAILASCTLPATMLQARANRGVPDAMRALAHLGWVAPAASRARPPRPARAGSKSGRRRVV